MYLFQIVFFFTHICFVESHVLFMLFIFIYVHCVYWCPRRFPYQMKSMSFNSNTTGFTSGAGTVYPSGAQPGY